MRLLWMNLVADDDDPVLGFCSNWIRAVATRVESIRVLTVRQGRLELPSNVSVSSVGKEKGFSRPRMIAEFYRELRRLLGQESFDLCFSHMNPIFTVLAGPALKLKRVPIVTWYAHASLTPWLRLAHRLSDRMITSLPSAYPYRRDKLTVIGQGIDTELFRPMEAAPEPDEPLTLLAAGRLSPVKDHPTLLRAVARLKETTDRTRVPFRVIILGSPSVAADEVYRSSLSELTRSLEIEEVVSFHDAVSPSELPAWYGASDLQVNMTPTGSGDKVVLESMACGRPCIAPNADFEKTFGRYADRLIYPGGDHERLAERLTAFTELTAEERGEMGRYLRQRVETMHSLSGLADRLVELFDQVSSDMALRNAARA